MLLLDSISWLKWVSTSDLSICFINRECSVSCSTGYLAVVFDYEQLHSSSQRYLFRPVCRKSSIYCFGCWGRRMLAKISQIHTRTDAGCTCFTFRQIPAFPRLRLERRCLLTTIIRTPAFLSSLTMSVDPVCCTSCA